MSHARKPWIVDYLLENGEIDDIDAAILRELIYDSRQKITSLAESLRISRPTLYERVKKLETKGYIRNYSVKLNYDKCGLPVTAFILVSYDTTKEDEGWSQRVVAKKLSELKFVHRVNIITGTYDFLVEVYIDHMNSLSDLIIEHIRKIKGVANTVTMVSFVEYRGGQMLTSS